MRDHHIGFWVGGVLMAVGLFMSVVLTRHDAFALGGAGLIVIGALAVAVSFVDAPEE
ncbi:MAG: hypothetical protein JST73_03380 [Actinobacteria bacterium]|nr:hypothetical protein [Actinomycetota bacterium]